MVNLLRMVGDRVWATLGCVAAVSAAAIVGGVFLFGLRTSGAIALFFVVWWIVLFAVLPFGARSQADAGEVIAGTEPGAPAAPALREKALWTTIVAAAVFLLAAGLLPLSGL
jgi:predicted secreted protein